MAARQPQEVLSYAALMALLLAFAACSLPIASKQARVRNLFDQNDVRTIGEHDGLVLVDFWQTRACIPTNKLFDALVTKVEPFARMARNSSATILHALGESEQTANLSNPLVRDRFWPTTRAQIRYAYPIVRDITTYLRKIVRQSRKPPPLDLIFTKDESSPMYCDRSVKGKNKPDPRLHRNITFDLSKDYMFDDGPHFKQMSELGIKRLYYTGAALNQCVLSTRMYSAIEAAHTDLFDEVGIILDLTLPTIRKNVPQPGCINVTDYECSQRFAKWMDVHLKLTKVKFFQTIP